MIHNLPVYISVLFFALVAYIFIWLLKVINDASRQLKINEEKSRRTFLNVWAVIFGWLALIAILALRGFFADYEAMPPKFALALFPPLIIIIILPFLKKTNRILQAIPPEKLIRFQSFRIAMELILWLLFVYGAAPEIMTLTGRNYDLIVGLTAPLIAWLCFKKKILSPTVAIIWNIAGILILANTVIHGILSSPVPFRQFYTDPPNTFITFFPFIWLPGFVVPFAFLLHFLSIRQLLSKKHISHRED